MSERETVSDRVWRILEDIWAFCYSVLMTVCFGSVFLAIYFLFIR